VRGEGQGAGDHLYQGIDSLKRVAHRAPRDCLLGIGESHTAIVTRENQLHVDGYGGDNLTI
jgi:hypothetical protein